eukprot:sb/3463666/
MFIFSYVGERRLRDDSMFFEKSSYTLMQWKLWLFPDTTYESFPAKPASSSPVCNADNRKTLGTFSGVVVPCTLSMLSAILFLRLGYVVGFAGFIETLIMFSLAFFIVMMTILSVSAISTNGAIEGGGAYFMISRSIGPEFGGAMGIIFFAAQLFGSVVYLLGLLDTIVDSFGQDGGTFTKTIPETGFWPILYGSALLVVMLIVVLVGAEMFAKTNLIIFVIVLVALGFDFVNFFIQSEKEISPPTSNTLVNQSSYLHYTSWSMNTLLENKVWNLALDIPGGRRLRDDSMFFEKSSYTLMQWKLWLFPDTTYESFPAKPASSSPVCNADNRKTLGTFSGVVVPCTLSMLSAILFLRLGYVVGFAGFIETLIMFSLAFFIVMMTILSVSAISTNGAIEGGGAYFMISRSIGPEFGGAMGIIFFAAQLFGSVVYLLGLLDTIVDSFGQDGGTFTKTIPETGFWPILYGSALLVVMLIVVLVGAEMFAKTNLIIFVIVLVALGFDFVNFFIQSEKEISPPTSNTLVNQSSYLHYTSWSMNTLLENK